MTGPGPRHLERQPVYGRSLRRNRWAMTLAVLAWLVVLAGGFAMACGGPPP